MANSYYEINNSFKKKLVYNLGSEAGFFSEYNNMILAMLYCLKHKIKFELYSKDANFAAKKGWSDYFIPFCEETTNSLHAKYNQRQIFEIESKKHLFIKKIFKFRNGIKYLTSDLWSKFHSKSFEKEIFDIPKLNINSGILEASQKLITITWKYNNETLKIINQYINQLLLPNKYIGLHIRSGDKVKEYDKIQVEDYINFAIKNSNIKEAYVLTDNYAIILELKQKFNNWNFYTLCQKNEKGYIHQEFITMEENKKKDNLLRLFASVDILSKAELFIGTFSSNPGMYLGMRMNIDKVKCLDFEKWIIW